MPQPERHRSSYNAETVAIIPSQLDFCFRGSRQKPPLEYLDRVRWNRLDTPDIPYTPPAPAAIALGGVSRQTPRRETFGRHTDAGRTWYSIVNTSADLRAAIHRAIEARRAGGTWGAIKTVTAATAALALVFAGYEMRHGNIEVLSTPAAPTTPAQNPNARAVILPPGQMAPTPKDSTINAAPVAYARGAAPANPTPTVTITVTKTSTAAPAKPTTITTTATASSPSSPETSDSSNASPSKSASQTPSTAPTSANPTEVVNSVDASQPETQSPTEPDTSQPRTSLSVVVAAGSMLATASAS